MKNLHKQKKTIIYSITLLAIVSLSFLTYNFIAKGATYGWLQASWSGGADTGAVATHTDNQSGWTKFFSKDSNAEITGEGKITMTTGTQDVLEASSAEFAQGSFSNVNITINNSADEMKFSWTCGTNKVIDSAGNSYSTVLIGTQCWMASNLNIGTRIAGTSNQTNNSTIEKYCYNNLDANCTTYGGLYQWDEMMQYTEIAGTQGICPVGWHIPTDAQQHILDDYLSPSACDPNRVNLWSCDPAGTALKSGGSSGFNGLLAGYRSTDGSFASLSTSAFFWSSTVSGSNAWTRVLSSTNATVYRYEYDQAYGFSVRCLKD
ncbi:MAG: putative lipoprotein [Candidatus Moranbacteria bacterium GW2011_GWF2_36_839]|nr:MAG: putative lipoprotein [Candidatus Moranbacteria bacterium GW2011_GWF1_36_78]KKQ16469.1 MAG: putative lipoprotein [Candidatus Moranbacteria bacterium GW2011_GWF2_36_839]HAT74163.1 hypothetical protein [Candidatus Moranbacteria bacterium]HBY11212.1 hypothetical protein [Candidatus Moranbacteria bacterium]